MENNLENIQIKKRKGWIPRLSENNFTLGESPQPLSWTSVHFGVNISEVVFLSVNSGSQFGYCSAWMFLSSFWVLKIIDISDSVWRACFPLHCGPLSFQNWMFSESWWDFGWVSRMVWLSVNLLEKNVSLTILNIIDKPRKTPRAQLHQLGRVKRLSLPHVAEQMHESNSGLGLQLTASEAVSKYYV